MTEAEGKSRLRVLFLEPFNGGSHAAFAQGLAGHSAHEVVVSGLPPRHWKWRMHGAALTFSEEYADRRRRGESWDLILLTSLIDVSDFRARICRSTGPHPPLLFYLHETQFDYPSDLGADRDARYGFRNLLSLVASDYALFNSASHRRRFLADAESFLRTLPKPVPKGLIREARAKSGVLYPGVEGPRVVSRTNKDKDRGNRGCFTFKHDRKGPLILWNHRWEHDKNPDVFFSALQAIDTPQLPWQLAVAGERYRHAPPVFAEAREKLDHRIAHFGYLEERAAYRRLLEESDIVVSTSRQENFGLSVVEAILAGAIPLLPSRLSYPELLPREAHDLLLYGSDGELPGLLRLVLQSPDRFRSVADLAEARLRNYRWEYQAPRFDRVMERIAERSCEAG